MKSGKKLLILIDADFVGGAETNFRFIFPTLRAQGYDPIVVAPGEENIRAYFERINQPIAVRPIMARYLPFSVKGRIAPGNILRTRRRLRQNARRLRQLCEEEQPAAIISNSMTSHLLLSRCRWEGVPRRVIHLHDIVSRERLGGLYGRMLDKMVRRVDRVITVSDAVTKTLPRDVLPQVTRLYNPISRDLPRREPGTPRGNPLRIGMFARYTPWKGHRHLFTISHALQDRPIQFVCFGNVSPKDEPYFAELERLRENLPQPDRVELNRFTPDIFREMVKCDAILHLSTSPEPSSRVLTEANACRVPLLAFEGGGTRELLQDLGFGGKLFKANDVGGVIDTLRRFHPGDYTFADPADLYPEPYTERFLKAVFGDPTA